MKKIEPGTLGYRLWAARRKSGMTQGAVGKLCGFNHTAVSKWEHNYNQPDAGSLAKMAARFGVTTDYLLRGESEAGRPMDGPTTTRTEAQHRPQPTDSPATTAAPDMESMLRELASGEMDTATLLRVLAVSTLLRDHREASEARAREQDSTARASDSRAREARDQDMRALMQAAGLPHPLPPAAPGGVPGPRPDSGSADPTDKEASGG